MFNTPLNVLWPDAFLLLATFLAWVNELVRAEKNEAGLRLTYAIAVWASIISAAGYAVLALQQQSYYFFSNMFVVDAFANVMKAFVSAGFAASLIYARQYLAQRDLLNGNFILLALFSLLGQLVMISGHHFLILYLGLELMSLSLYAMIALRRGSTLSAEAALKYYVLGALASGFLLYGISMLYGATGSLDVADVFRAIATGYFNYTALLFGLIFIVVSIAFKLGAVPFHMWVPDVYHGAPTSMTLLTAGGPKVATFAWGLRFLVGGLLPLAVNWQQMLIIPATLSLIVGNLAGIMQKNVKRMLAYSAIANMGFVFLALLSGVVNGQAESAQNAYSSAMFYSLVYLVTTLGAFGVILRLAQRGFEADHIDDLKGLSQRNPALAFAMLVMMFSLAGIPPTAGFYAKFAVLAAVVNAGFTWLAVLAVLTSLCGAFYYLRIVKLMYFDAPTQPTPLTVCRSAQTLLTVNGLAVLALGIMPGPLMSLCLRSIQQMLIS